MPNRPKKGESSNGRLHNIFSGLLGGLVSNASNNVEADPTFSADTPDPNDMGEAGEPLTQNQTPFKATGLFGKKEAQERNLDYTKSQLDAGTDVSKAKSIATNTADINVKLEDTLKQIGLKYAPIEIANRLKEARAKQNMDVLQTAGIPADENGSNLADFQTNVVPNRINQLQSGAIRNTSENLLGNDQAQLANTLLNNTKANKLMQGQFEAQGAEDKARENLATIPIQAAAERSSLFSSPAVTQAKISSELNTPIGPNGNINLQTGARIEPTYSDPAKQMAAEKVKMLQKLTNKAGTPAAATAPAAPINSNVTVVPASNYVEIPGVGKFIIKK